VLFAAWCGFRIPHHLTRRGSDVTFETAARSAAALAEQAISERQNAIVTLNMAISV